MNETERKAEPSIETVFEEKKRNSGNDDETHPGRKGDTETAAETMKPATSAPNLSTIKIKKRELEKSNSSAAFSRRSNTPTTTDKPHSSSSVSQQPAWVKPAAPPSSPSVASAYSASSDSSEPPQKKLRAPSRRGEVRYERNEPRDEHPKPQHYDDRVAQDIAYKKQDLNISIRQHYNERAWDSKRERRALSPIIKLRNFNNVVKHILIQESVGGPGARVLDLGCGKGGDLRKWELAQVSQYTGIDISNASIMEAMRRYRSNRSSFPVVFTTGDAFGLPLPEILYEFPEVQFPMDVVSMQFCLHYAFETEAKARQTIENVARSLRPGGIFIGTIPNSEFIGHKIRHLMPGSRSFGNDLYSVTFEQQPPKTGEFVKPYGNVYNYYLKDAIDNVPEYIIPFETLRAICSDYGLRLKFKQPFHEYFSQKIPTWYNQLSPRVIEGIRKDKGGYGVSGQESEATSYFYLAFTFVKAG
jgi:mRNA (guanine-N7-)-methyltransferase